MPTLDGDGQPINKNGTRASGSTSSRRYSNVNSNPPLPDLAAEVAFALRAVMLRFVDHQQGSLKLTRSQTGADLHLIFTWTAGKYTGKYVYQPIPYWHLAYGLEVLWDKVQEVEAGVRQPTPDKMVAR